MLAKVIVGRVIKQKDKIDLSITIKFDLIVKKINKFC
jgi:hypothetical protein